MPLSLSLVLSPCLAASQVLTSPGGVSYSRSWWATRSTMRAAFGSAVSSPVNPCLCLATHFSHSVKRLVGRLRQLLIPLPAQTLQSPAADLRPREQCSRGGCSARCCDLQEYQLCRTLSCHSFRSHSVKCVVRRFRHRQLLPRLVQREQLVQRGVPRLHTVRSGEHERGEWAASRRSGQPHTAGGHRHHTQRHVYTPTESVS